MRNIFYQPKKPHRYKSCSNQSIKAQGLSGFQAEPNCYYLTSKETFQN